MNSIEHVIYKLVSDYPWIRKPLVDIYQRAMSIFSANPFEPISDLRIIEGCFFGFHDKIPWSYDNKYILTHRFNTKLPLKKVETTPIEIGLFNPDYSFQFITQSKCWNWQQGSMLQWLGKNGDIAFNDFKDKECIRIFSKDGTELSQLDGHMGAAHPDGQKILSYNYGRLTKAAKEYGYQYYDDAFASDNVPNQDGLWLIDSKSNHKKLIISLNQLLLNAPLKSMGNSYHFVTHTNYSPDGKHYCFLHRWRNKLGRLFSRLYIGCSSTHKLRFFSLYDISHISWNGNSNLFIYGWLHKNLSGYISLDINNMQSKLVKLSIPNLDGHPQVSKKGLIVTDSYPDRARLQSLYVSNLTNGDCYLIQKSKIPHKYKNARRCDFHPRWDRNGNKICFDSAHTGVRSLCILEKFEINDKRFLFIPNKRKQAD